MRRQRHPRGMTLVEVMIGMALVAVAMLALVSANTLAARASSRSYRHHMAMRLAQQRVDTLVLGDLKPKLRPEANGPSFVHDGTMLDCQEAFGAAAGTLAELCNGSKPELVGWVDIYGRPCRKTGKPEEGFHPTCQYRRYVRFERTIDGTSQGDLWRVFVAVSHASDGTCGNFREGDTQCVVTSAVLTR
ncbi:prepilin-type N-terminal cleavage/methylation domain-containing protein [Archangium gephyra]|uniref:Prepilin-type N-terminal cleavage/methylation domain-containing protein n=2 Tax=Archangium gephyra TaxID=48 RepID=A0ABX9KAA7_9BACT|nr:prepilin-type N-terminal cleavage/methylation domain-containing protein [Archangium gephyra]REG37066.1 prepilin-type N-terminal cleavage/methylation domain-containing protein [Archangium gephyra]